MNELGDLYAQIPVSQIASSLGVDESQAADAIGQLLPALVGGLGANAADPAGADSIARALADHDPGSLDNLDVANIDAGDGQAILNNIFGPNTDEVTQRLGAASPLDSGIVRKLLPILAPIVLAWLSRKVQQRAGAGAGGSIITAILSAILGGAAGGMGGLGGSNRTSTQASGGGLGDILSDMIGGGQGGVQDDSATDRMPGQATTQQSPQGTGIDSILADLLGQGRR